MSECGASNPGGLDREALNLRLRLGLLDELKKCPRLCFLVAPILRNLLNDVVKAVTIRMIRDIKITLPGILSLIFIQSLQHARRTMEQIGYRVMYDTWPMYICSQIYVRGTPRCMVVV
jgi:hypothetical protein